MPLPGRPLAFSLRTMMVLVGVLCLVAAWAARERAVVLERRSARLLRDLVVDLGEHRLLFEVRQGKAFERDELFQSG